jgi:site-specific recombinase XerC
MSQACNATMAYLETNKVSEKEDAAIFISEAKKHLTAQK